MRRLIFASLSLASFGLFLGSIESGCGGSAVGVEACRKIEATRCNASAACGASTTEVTYCNDLYRDQCLYGLQNPSGEPNDAAVQACVAAIAAAEACVRAGVTSLDMCPSAPLIEGALATTAPCDVITRRPELLQACTFVAAPFDAGQADPGDGDAASDASDDVATE